MSIFLSDQDIFQVLFSDDHWMVYFSFQVRTENTGIATVKELQRIPTLLKDSS